MASPHNNSSPPDDPEGKLKIYFLPNLFTAGNLICGFVALTKIVEANIDQGDYSQVKIGLGFILAACIFDLFDGRVARAVGAESPFGREFDSLADLISFGAAPAFLVHRIVLRDVFVGHQDFGWFIASIYLLCGAFRLARFNCLAEMAGTGGGKEFLGFPIPAAAGLVSSLTLFLIWWDETDFNKGNLRYLLPVLLLFLSAMMVSSVKYPTFKSLGLRTKGTFTKTVVGAMFIGSLLILQEKILYWVLPFVFTSYLLYGFIRPRISRKVRDEIEEDEDDEGDEIRQVSRSHESNDD